MLRKTQWFATLEEAYAFAAGKQRVGMVSCFGNGWTVGWDDPESFDVIVSRNGGEGKVEAPAEIAQRLKVRSVGLDADGEFYVCLNGLSDSFQSMYVSVTQADTRRFTVGSEIEVVLRPAPLA